MNLPPKPCVLNPTLTLISCRNPLLKTLQALALAEESRGRAEGAAKSSGGKGSRGSSGGVRGQPRVSGALKPTFMRVYQQFETWQCIDSKVLQGFAI